MFEPLKTRSLSIEFVSEFSPWWLCILIPIILYLGWRWYKPEVAKLTTKQKRGLVFLRLFLMAFLVFLFFKPNLISRLILTYPGRILFLVDDSMSMQVKDSAMPEGKAMKLSRHLGTKIEQSLYHEQAVLLNKVEKELYRFQLATADLDRSSDQFWNVVTPYQDRINELLGKFDEIGNDLKGAEKDLKVRHDQALEILSEFRSSLNTYFSGSTAPSNKVYEKSFAKLQVVRQSLFACQEMLDKKMLTNDDSRKGSVQNLRTTTRQSLLQQSLKKHHKEIISMVPDQNYELVTLMGGTRESLEQGSIDNIEARSGLTDILTGLQNLVEEKNDFPLSSIVLLSDGRDLSGKDPRPILQALSRKEVALHTVALGETLEPYDVAIQHVIAPPFAMTKQRTTIKLELKTVLKEPADIDATIFQGSKKLVTKNLRVGEEKEMTADLQISPESEGLHRYKVVLKSVAGEAFTKENNVSDFTMNVRKDKVRVLFLDWKPRWESRFALNIFQRLSYIDLNAIIVLSTKESNLKRGVGLGTWPKNKKVLNLYDLIVLGELPDDLLSDQEWQDLKTYVTEEGKSLCVLRGKKSKHRLQDILPVKSLGNMAAIKDRSDIEISSIGKVHPLTRALSQSLTGFAGQSLDKHHDNAFDLLRSKSDGSSVISTRFVGKGKTLLINHDQLWRLLHPAQLMAHRDLYFYMVPWAVEGGFKGEERNRAQLALDQQVEKIGQSVQVWLQDGAAEATIEAHDGENVVASAKTSSLAKGSKLQSAVFTKLPASDLSFRLKSNADIKSPKMVVIDNKMEYRHLSLNPGFLKKLSDSTGGKSLGLTQMDTVPKIKPKVRVEKHEKIWKLWDSVWIMILLVSFLTIEWVWRKFSGLI